jgi:hypothetical protein
LESIHRDARLTWSASIRCGKDLKLALEVVRIVGKLLYVILRKSMISNALVRVETRSVALAYIDVGFHSRYLETKIEMFRFPGSHSHCSLSE